MKKLLAMLSALILFSTMNLIPSVSEARNPPPLRAYSCHHVADGVVSPMAFAYVATLESPCPPPPHRNQQNNNLPVLKVHPLDHDCEVVTLPAPR